jgi:8-oxo-dGTP pyrophosphatase MutT (NUDIX family)
MPDVVSCILEYNDKILLLQRSQKVGTYKGLWGAITGFVEANELPLQTAYKEIYEECGISKKSLNLKSTLDPISFVDTYQGQDYRWVVHAFVFLLNIDPIIHLDWEHDVYKWIKPDEIYGYQTVPKLKEIVEKIFL